MVCIICPIRINMQRESFLKIPILTDLHQNTTKYRRDCRYGWTQASSSPQVNPILQVKIKWCFTGFYHWIQRSISLPLYWLNTASLAQREPGRKLQACFYWERPQKSGKYLYKLKTYRKYLFCTSFSLYWSNWKFKEGFYCLPFGFFHLNISKIVDSSELDESREHKGKADRYEPVHGSSIGYFWQWMSCTDAQRRHCQHCGYSFKEIKQKHCWIRVKQRESRQAASKNLKPLRTLSLLLAH